MTTLTASEEIVMESVWELGGNCTLSQILTQSETHGKVWKLQTVATFLKHMHQKGFVRPYKDGRFLHYEVLVPEHEYRMEKLAKLIDFWNDGNKTEFVYDLFRENVLSKKEQKTVKKIFYESVN